MYRFLTATVAIGLAAVIGMGLVVPGGGTASAQVGGSSSGGLTVIGSASTSVEPDLAVLSLSVTALEPTAVAAVTAANFATAEVIVALRIQRVATEDIRTTSISLDQEFEFTGSCAAVPVGFRFTNSLRVTVRDLDAVGATIDGAVAAAGDNLRLDGISFDVSNRTEIEDELRLSAIDQAIARAQAIAARAGVSLGRIVAISDLGFASPVSVDFGDGVDEALATPVFGGTQEIVMSVQIQFELR